MGIDIFTDLLELPEAEVIIRPRESARTLHHYHFCASSRHGEVIGGGWVDLCGRQTASSESLTRKVTLQHHLRAPWGDEVIKEAGGVNCIIESEFPQDSETDPFTGGGVGV